MLQRSEVVALFNTYHRISESIKNIEQFRQLYEKTFKLEQNHEVELTLIRRVKNVVEDVVKYIHNYLKPVINSYKRQEL